MTTFTTAAAAAALQGPPTHPPLGVATRTATAAATLGHVPDGYLDGLLRLLVRGPALPVRLAVHEALRQMLHAVEALSPAQARRIVSAMWHDATQFEDVHAVIADAETGRVLAAGHVGGGAVLLAAAHALVRGGGTQAALAAAWAGAAGHPQAASVSIPGSVAGMCGQGSIQSFSKRQIGLTWSNDGTLLATGCASSGAVDTSTYIDAVARLLSEQPLPASLFDPIPIDQLGGLASPGATSAVSRKLPLAVAQATVLSSADDASTGVHDFLVASKQLGAADGAGGHVWSFQDVAAACANRASHVETLLQGVHS